MKNLVGAVIGLLVGVMVGYFAFSGGDANSSAEAGNPLTSNESEESNSSDNRSTTPSGSNKATPRSQPEEKKTTPEVVEKPETRAAAKDLSSAIEAYARSVRKMEIPQGEGVISGVVKTTDGQPLAGVEIQLNAFPLKDDAESIPSPTAMHKGFEKGFDVAKHVKREIENTIYWRSNELYATTGADGTFSFTGLGELRCSLKADKAGYKIETQMEGVGYGQLRPDAEVTFTARKFESVDVSVLMPDGSEAPGAWISFQSDSQHDRQGWNPQQRQLSVVAGRYQVSADFDYKGSSYQSDSVSLDLVEASTTRNVSLQFKLVPKILVKIKRTWTGRGGNKGDRNMYITYKALGDGEVANKDSLKGRMVENEYAWGDSKEFEVSENTRYAVGIGRDWGSADQVQEVVVGSENAEVIFEIGAPVRSEHVEVWVYDPKGNAISDGVDFSTSVRYDGGSSSGGSHVLYHPNGSYWVRHHHFDDDDDEEARANATYTVSATSEVYGSKSATYSWSEAARIEIRFTEPATLEVQISGYEASPYKGKLSLSISGPIEESISDNSGVNEVSMAGEANSSKYYGGDHRSEGSVNEKGIASFSALSAGRYRIIMQLEVDREDWTETKTIGSEEVVLSAGKNHFTMGIPQLYDLIIQIPGAEKGESVNLQNKKTNDYHSAETDDNGSVTFKGLSAGKYTVSHWGGEMGSQQMEVTVPAGGPVVFKKIEYNAFEVTLREGTDGIFRKAGFQTGDLIYGVDGVEFTSQQQAQVLLMAAMAKETCSLMVDRSGVEMKIEMSLKGMMSGKRPDADIDAAQRKK